MVSKNDNPLQPLQTIRLTQGEKEIMWDNICAMAVAPSGKAARKPSGQSEAFTTRWSELHPKLNKRQRLAELFKSSAAAVAIVCIVAGGAWIWNGAQHGSKLTPANHSAQRSFPSGFDWFNNPGYLYAVQHNLAFGVGESETNHYGTVKLLGVLCDVHGAVVLYSYTGQPQATRKPKVQTGPTTRISVEGQPVTTNGSSSSFEYHGNTVFVQANTRFTRSPSNHVLLTIRVNKFGHKDITWNFKVHVDMAKIRAATHVYTVGKTISLGAAGTMRVESITWGPLSVRVKDEWRHAQSWTRPITPILVDAQGRFLYQQGGPITSGLTRTVTVGTRTDVIQDQSTSLASTGPIPKSIGIVPTTIYTKSDAPPTVSVSLERLPQQMALGAFGRVTIEDVKYTHGGTTVIYRYAGPFTFPMGFFQIKSQSGAMLSPTSVQLLKRQQAPSTYTTMEAVFPALPSKHGNVIESVQLRASDPSSHMAVVKLVSK